MTVDKDNQPMRVMTKVVYFDEESASDYLDISAGGKETSIRENIKERTKSTHADVETSLIAKLSWLPFFGGSADVSAGAGLSAAGRSILNKTLSNTILTDYLEKSADDERILQLRDLRVAAPKDSMAYMKMYTPYMVILKMDDLPVDLARLDEALTGAKGYYELFGIDEAGTKSVLRFNIRAFRNSYGLADLGRMRLVFHGILVGQTSESDLSMKAEMSLNAGEELVTATEVVDGVSAATIGLLDVYDVLLAGVEYAG